MTHRLKNIAESIDVEPLINIMKSFYEFSKIPQGIFDKNQNTICEFGTQKVCGCYHRTSEQTAGYCTQKYNYLNADDKIEEISVCQCANGLMTYTVPVLVKDELIAVAYLGQFFTEPPNMEFFERQAERYGFAKDDYLQAITEVPLVDPDLAEKAACFLAVFSRILAASAANSLESIENEEKTRLKEQQRSALMASLLKIYNNETNDRDQAIRNITEITAQALDVDYVSFCRQCENNKNDLYTYRYVRKENFHEQYILENDIPKHQEYFDALGNGLVIVADDAVADNRTRSYNEDHHFPLGIVSTIEAPTKLMGNMTGVLSIEQAGEKRHWSQDEIYFSLLAERMLTLSLDWFEKQELERERRMLEESLLQSRKMDALGVLAGGIAHEFNNILGVILGYAELAIRTLPADGSAAINEYLQEICKSSMVAQKTIERVLAFSRKSESMPIAVNIDKAFSEMLKYFDKNGLPDKIAMKFSSSVRGLRVYIDPNQLHQVTLNLIKNAIYSMRHKGGCINIVLERFAIGASSQFVDSGLEVGNYLKFVIADEGEGIPDEILPQVFDPYFTTKPQAEGTGMGLAMVHGIVSAAGGWVGVESKKGQGSIFTVLLPICADTDHEEPLTNMTAGLDAEMPVFEGHAVCIDSDGKMAKIAGRMLQLMGFESSVYDDPLILMDGLATMECKIDVAVIGMRLSNMSGLQLAQRMKKLCPDIETILMAPAGDIVGHDELVAHGVSIIIEKPLRFADLMQTIGLIYKERKQNEYR